MVYGLEVWRTQIEQIQPFGFDSPKRNFRGKGVAQVVAQNTPTEETPLRLGAYLADLLDSHPISKWLIILKILRLKGRCSTN
jgi:hypothetical protein